MLLMIDNYDSFTYNLVQYFADLGEVVEVYRNDQIESAALAERRPSKIVISPGPGTPKQAGISMQIIKDYAGKVPILGVCLGHQCIGEVYGGEVARAGAVMHGKTSLVHHDGSRLYEGLEQPFQATRYHSLVVKPEKLPACLQVTAWTQQVNGDLEEIMGLQHRQLPIYGVQFHPESILTPQGKTLLENFLKVQA